MVRRRVTSWNIVAVAVVAAVVACTPPGPRPCRESAQCNDGDVCVIPRGETVGACTADDDGAEGEGEVGEGEGEGEGVAVEVQAGGVFACAIDDTARVQCWGGNGKGQLGRDTGGVVDLVPAPVPGLTDVTALAVGNTHACALGRVGGASQDLHCWGDNNNGTLGTGLIVVPHGTLVTPLAPGLGLAATSIDADGDNDGGITCVASTGDVRCFGPSVEGADDGRPLVLSVFAGAVRVRVATDVVCGFDESNVARCFRADTFPGVASTTTAFGCAADGPCPLLDGGRDFDTEIDIGCRIVDGDAHCGGDNTFGVADPGARSIETIAAGLVLTGVADVSTGIHHACAVALTGEVSCWGHTLFGATGFVVTDQAIAQSVPCETVTARCQPIVEVPLPAGMGDVEAISTHQTLSCVRDEAGAVACWGTIGASASEGRAPTRFPLAP